MPRTTGRNALYEGDRARSDENYARAIVSLEDRLGELHSDTIAARQDHAVQLNLRGMHADAEAAFRDVPDCLITLYGEQHRAVADNYQNLATAITYQSRYTEPLPLHRKAYEIYKAELQNQYVTAFPLSSIASIEVERGNGPAAYAAASEALQRLSATLPDTYAGGIATCLVGLVLELTGQVERGAAMVGDFHALILKREVLVPKYMALCRVLEPHRP